VPSDVGVRAKLIVLCPPNDGAALFLIETDSISRFSRTFDENAP
jgi:hypothetical protein